MGLQQLECWTVALTHVVVVSAGVTFADTRLSMNVTALVVLVCTTMLDTPFFFVSCTNTDFLSYSLTTYVIF